MKSVAIPIEIKSREFIGKVWLAKNLISDDIEIILGDRRAIEKIIFDIRPDFYLALGTDPRRREYIKSLSECTTVGILDSEGAPTKTNVVEMNDPESMDHIDIYFSWGAQQSKRINSAFGGDKLKTVTSGSPSFDLLHKKLNHVYEKYPYSHLPDTYILLLTGFNRINGKGSVKHAKNDKEKKWQQKMLNKYIRFIKLFTKKFDCHLVIRPHPVENDHFYEQLAESFARVCVKSKGSVRYLINASSVVVHSGSTAAIESFILGKPILSLNAESGHNTDTLPVQISHSVHSVPELTRSINRALLDKKAVNSIANSVEERLKNRIHNSYEAVAAQIISDNISHELNAKEKNGKGSTRCVNHTLIERLERQAYKRKATNIFYEWNSVFEYIDSLAPTTTPTLSGRRFRQFPGISDNEIEQLLRKFDCHDDVYVERVDSYADVFRIGTSQSRIRRPN